MIENIYIEEQVANHPRTLEILARFPDAMQIRCSGMVKFLIARHKVFDYRKKIQL